MTKYLIQDNINFNMELYKLLDTNNDNNDINQKEGDSPQHKIKDYCLINGNLNMLIFTFKICYTQFYSTVLWITASFAIWIVLSQQP
jgi:hypothetical protein